MAGDRRLAVITGSAFEEGDVDLGDGSPVVLVNRHLGSGGSFVPAHRLDHAATLRALVADGCTHVLAFASTGTLRADWPVGTIVAPDDFFSPWSNPTSFDDTRGHRVPGFDAEWRAEVVGAWQAAVEAPIVDGGVYVQTRGPRFETPAEIRWYATVGDLVGMTVASECIIAGELGLRYAAVCTVDNLANGIEGEALTVEAYEEGAAANRAGLSTLVGELVRGLLDGWR